MEWSRRISLRILFMHNTYYIPIFSLKSFFKTSILTALKNIDIDKKSEIFSDEELKMASEFIAIFL